MTGSVAIDVVIGLVFIYLLYSLFATVVLEILNTIMGLRARNLRYALRRMLKDEKEESNYWKRVVYKLGNFFFKPIGKGVNFKNDTLFDAFYNQPTIKYLSAGATANKSSYIASHNFSKSLIDTLQQNYSIDGLSDKIKAKLETYIDDSTYLNTHSATLQLLGQSPSLDRKWLKAEDGFRKAFKNLLDTDKLKIVNALLPELHDFAALRIQKGTKDGIARFLQESFQNKNVLEKIITGISFLPEDSDTRKHIASLLSDAQNDLEKFNFLLEQWYDDTMERATGWFKRRTQFFLFFIGMVIAIGFNANTVDIIKKLSRNPEAREQMVQLAIAYSDELKGEVEGQESGNNQKASNSADAIKDELKKLQVFKDTVQQKFDSIKTDPLQQAEIERLQKDIDSVDRVKRLLEEDLKFIKTKDSLLQVAKKLRGDIENAQDIIGTNWQIPDSLKFYNNSHEIDTALLRNVNREDLMEHQKALTVDYKIKKEDTIKFSDKTGNNIVLTLENMDKTKLFTGKCDVLDSVQGFLLYNTKDTLEFAMGSLVKWKNSLVLRQKKKVYFLADKSLNTKFLLKSVPDTMDLGSYLSHHIKIKKWTYKIQHVLTNNNFWGYLLTALAISMGSTFWFDLLNKLVNLRNSLRPKEEERQNPKDKGGAKLMERVG